MWVASFPCWSGHAGRAGALLTKRDEPAARCERVGHRDVVRLGGQFVDEFVVAHHRDQPRRRTANGNVRS